MSQLCLQGCVGDHCAPPAGGRKPGTIRATQVIGGVRVTYVWSYLTSPGRSMTQYVLRLTALLVVGWAIVQTMMFIPGLISRSVRIEFSLRPDRIFEAQVVLATGIAALACVIASVLAWALVLVLRRVSGNRALIALMIGALAATPIFVAVRSIGAVPAASVVVAGYFGCIGFVTAMAVQVGRLTSNLHGVVASSLLLVMTSIVVGVISSSITPQATACEERLSPERERCITRQEGALATAENWLLFDKLSSDDWGDLGD